MIKRMIFSLMLMVISLGIEAKNDSIVYILKIDEEIAPPAWHKTKKAFEDIKDLNVRCIILHLNTFGGTLEDADKIRSQLLESPVPVYTLIDINAASAGALIAIATDSIYMRRGASIGAATVVDQSGAVVPDKYQSYMRAMMRATAMAKHRRPDIAEAMVDPDVHIPGIVDSGKVLTLTTQEAIVHGYATAQVETLDGLLERLNMSDIPVQHQHLTAVDKLILFFSRPLVSGLLIMMILGGLYMEFQAPGLGLPGLLALIAAVLFFIPHYAAGLAEHWEILLFVIGLGLLALEIFVIPGFGVAGISGIILLTVALILTLVDNVGFDFSGVDAGHFGRSLATVGLSLFAGLSIGIYLSTRLFKTNRLSFIALNDTMDKEKGYISIDSSLSNLIGSQGCASTDLRPVGKVVIDGELYTACAENGYIEKGTLVQVYRFENAQLFVRKIECKK